MAEIFANEEKPVVPEFPEQVMSKDRQIRVIKMMYNFLNFTSLKLIFEIKKFSLISIS